MTSKYPSNILAGFDSRSSNWWNRVKRKINLTVICIEMEVHIMSSYNVAERRHTISTKSDLEQIPGELQTSDQSERYLIHLCWRIDFGLWDKT